MKIERVELRQLRMPYVFPFETSMDRDEDKDCLLVRVWADGVSGWGESPVTAKPYYKEETVDTAWPILANFAIPRVLGREFSDPREVAGWLRPVRRNYLAKAGLEAAAWDAHARSRGISLARALGGMRPKIAVGMSVGIEPTVDAVLRRIDTWLAQGYQRIKMKIKPGSDVEVVDAIRRRFGPIGLQVDANASYTLQDTPRLRSLDGYDLIMIEQPLDHDDIIDHATLQRELRTPLCLDESICSAEDARKALDIGACGIINIKAARMGGLTEALRCHDVCRSRGIPVWCGGFLETGVGRAANVALSSLENFTLPADLGASRRYFHEDIIDPWVEVNADGTVDVPAGPGLGVAVVEPLVEKYTLRKETFRARVTRPYRGSQR
ncbi:MAG TPA: o-succinylbenzoate synthase [bacterium]|nr:o-succinylbenzoate synthase [bacterium]